MIILSRTQFHIERPWGQGPSRPSPWLRTFGWNFFKHCKTRLHFNILLTAALNHLTILLHDCYTVGGALTWCRGTWSCSTWPAPAPGSPGTPGPGRTGTAGRTAAWSQRWHRPLPRPRLQWTFVNTLHHLVGNLLQYCKFNTQYWCESWATQLYCVYLYIHILTPPFHLALVPTWERCCTWQSTTGSARAAACGQTSWTSRYRPRCPTRVCVWSSSSLSSSSSSSSSSWSRLTCCCWCCGGEPTWGPWTRAAPSPCSRTRPGSPRGELCLCGYFLSIIR